MDKEIPKDNSVETMESIHRDEDISRIVDPNAPCEISSNNLGQYLDNLRD